MRQIFTLISCFILFLITAAQSPKDGKNVIKMRATATPSTEKPLFVIDGVVCDEFDLKKMDPNNIESINILKDVGPTTIYCNWSSRGIIIITTKTAKQRVIKVNDILTGEVLAGATVELVYKENGKDISLLMKTDSAGCLVTNKIVNGEEYELRVSYVGYKTFITPVNSKTVGKSYSILLERNYSELGEVVVTANATKTIRCWACCITGITKDVSFEKTFMKHDYFRICSNPTKSGSDLKIEIKNYVTGETQIDLFNLAGQLINTSEINVYEKNPVLMYNLPNVIAGTYLLRITNKKSQNTQTEKIIIQ